MSWQATLDRWRPHHETPAQYPHNPQNPPKEAAKGNSADIADIAARLPAPKPTPPPAAPVEHVDTARWLRALRHLYGATRRRGETLLWLGWHEQHDHPHDATREFHDWAAARAEALPATAKLAALLHADIIEPGGNQPTLAHVEAAGRELASMTAAASCPSP